MMAHETPPPPPPACSTWKDIPLLYGAVTYGVSNMKRTSRSPGHGSSNDRCTPEAPLPPRNAKTYVLSEFASVAIVDCIEVVVPVTLTVPVRKSGSRKRRPLLINSSLIE